MTGFPAALKPVRGGFVLLDPATGRPIRVIPFQFNPDTLTRTLQPQGIGPDPGDRLETQRLTGPPHESYRFEAEFDATEQLGQPDQHPVEAADGLHPVLAALELSVYPASGQLVEENRLASQGMIEISPIEAPLLVLVLGRRRVLAVQVTELTITEEAFDTALNPIRARVGVTVRVLTVDDLGFSHKGGLLYLQHHRQKEQLATLVDHAPTDLGVTTI